MEYSLEVIVSKPRYKKNYCIGANHNAKVDRRPVQAEARNPIRSVIRDR
jgi:hypothetical protein